MYGFGKSHKAYVVFKESHISDELTAGCLKRLNVVKLIAREFNIIP